MSISPIFTTIFYTCIKIYGIYNPNKAVKKRRTVYIKQTFVVYPRFKYVLYTLLCSPQVTAINYTVCLYCLQIIQAAIGGARLFRWTLQNTNTDNQYRDWSYLVKVRSYQVFTEKRLGWKRWKRMGCGEKLLNNWSIEIVYRFCLYMFIVGIVWKCSHDTTVISLSDMFNSKLSSEDLSMLTILHKEVTLYYLNVDTLLIFILKLTLGFFPL